MVIDCQAKGCSFNHDRKCQTIGINVGGPEPLCDTFVSGSAKGGIHDANALVGACKVQTCMNNTSLECQAEGIRVVYKNNQAWCGSFQSRE